MRFSRAWILCAGFSSLAACSGASPSSQEGELVGNAEIAITTVPPIVQCIQVTATGSTTTTTNLAVTVGSSSATLTVGRLPLGGMQFTALAFDAACSAIAGAQPTWVADPVSATLRAGVPTDVTLTFRQNNPVVATANFVQDATSIVASNNQGTYMVMTDGTIRTTGQPATLGSPSEVFASSTSSAQATGVLALAAGIEHVCFIKKADGSVWCAGTNAFGQVGPGVAVGAVATAPVQVTFPSGTGPARAIAAGDFFTCAIASTGTIDNVFCWGDNNVGQLGRNSAVSMSATPAAVQVSPTVVGTASPLHVNGGFLASGTDHACIGGDVLDQETGVWCWGDNATGQLGDGTTTTPTGAVVLQSISHNVVALALGDFFSCDLGATGVVQCWGDNELGEIGDGTFTQRPFPVANGITDATQIVATTFSVCALHPNGTVSCWGSNLQGEMGTGSAAQSIPSPVTLGLSGVSSLAAGGESAYAFMPNGTIQAWGYNSFGALGDGTEVTRFLPVPVLTQ